MLVHRPGARRVRLIRLSLPLAALALAIPIPVAADQAPFPTATTLSSSANPTAEGDAVTLTAAVEGAGWPGGSVSFTDYELGPLASAPLEGGKATVTLPPMSPGLHLLAASYAGDGVFAPSDGRLTLRVGPPVTASVAVSADQNPTRPGQEVTLSASVQTAAGFGMASGSLTVMEAGTPLATLPVALLAAPPGHSGPADQLSFATALPAGVHTITALYSGDGNLTGGTSATWTQVVGERVATTTTLVPPANPALGGQISTLTATVSPSTPASTQPSGTLTFRDGSRVLGRASVAAGLGSLAVSLLDAGPHALSAAYSGDGDFLGSTSPPLALQVLGLGGGPTPTTTSLAAGPSPLSFGQAVTLKASVSATAGSDTPTGGVYFADESGAVLGSSALDDAGQALLTTSTLSPGSHRVKAVYAGGSRFAHSSSDALDVDVERAEASISPLSGTAPSVDGKKVTVAVGVGGQAGVPPGGSVSFVGQGSVLGTALVGAQGNAELDLDGLSAGLHRVIAVYNGDANYGSVSLTLTVLVPGPVTTTTALQASQTRVLPSRELKLTATVAATSPAADAPGGEVSFKEGDQLLGSGQLDPQGEAQLTVPALATGQHTITASFPGGGSLQPSSGTVTVQVLGGDEPGGDSG
jgi:hypothetical protein